MRLDETTAMEEKQRLGPDGLIDGLRLEGEFRDQGQFSLDVERGRSLQQLAQLHDPTSYMLKWIQAAIRLGCKQIRLFAHSQGIAVRGEFPNEVFSLETLRDTLAGNSWALTDSALRDVAVGVHAAKNRFDTLVVQFDSTALEIDKDGAMELGEGKRPKRGFLVLGVKPNADWHSGHQHSSRARYSSTPVLCHGGKSSPAPYSFTTAMSRVLLVEARLGDPKVRQVDGVAIRDQPIDNLVKPDAASSMGALLQVSHQPEHPARAILLINAELEGLATIHFVKGGVTMEPVHVDLGCPGAICICSADGLTTDLSEFRITENEAYRDRLHWLRGQLAECLQAVRPRLAQLEMRRESLRGTVGSALVAVAASAWCNPIVGLLGGALAGVYCYLLRQEHLTGDQVRKHVNGRLDSLSIQ